MSLSNIKVLSLVSAAVVVFSACATGTKTSDVSSHHMKDPVTVRSAPKMDSVKPDDSVSRVDGPSMKKSRDIALARMANEGDTKEASSETKLATESDRVSGGAMHVTTSLLNVRSGPSVSNDVVKVLYFKEKVSVLENEGNWAKIGPNQYVFNKYLSKSILDEPNDPLFGIKKVQ